MTGLMAWSNDDSGAIVACFNQEGVGLQGAREVVYKRGSTIYLWIAEVRCGADPLPWGAQVRFTFAFESYKTGQELKQTVSMIDYECLLLFY